MFEPRVVRLEKVEWHGPNKFVTLRFDGGAEFVSANRKDFFCPEEEWESVIIPGAKLRLWTIQYSRVLGFEVLNDFDTNELAWIPVWCQGNNFNLRRRRRKK